MSGNFFDEIEAARERMYQRDSAESLEVRKRIVWEQKKQEIMCARDADGGLPIDSIPAFFGDTKAILNGFVRSLDNAMIEPEKITVEWRKGAAAGLLQMAGLDPSWKDRNVYGWLFAIGKGTVGNSNGDSYYFCAVTPNRTIVPTPYSEHEEWYIPGTVKNSSFSNQFYVESCKKHGAERGSYDNADNLIGGFNPAMFHMSYPEEMYPSTVDNSLIRRQVAETIAHLDIEWVE